jgi:hypothetical protein
MSHGQESPGRAARADAITDSNIDVVGRIRGHAQILNDEQRMDNHIRRHLARRCCSANRQYAEEYGRVYRATYPGELASWTRHFEAHPPADDRVTVYPAA